MQKRTRKTVGSIIGFIMQRHSYHGRTPLPGLPAAQAEANPGAVPAPQLLRIKPAGELYKMNNNDKNYNRGSAEMEWRVPDAARTADMRGRRCDWRGGDDGHGHRRAVWCKVAPN